MGEFIMKSYTWKLAIAFALSYALLVMVVVFAYTHISSSFILRQAKDNMAQKGGVMAERINTQLSFDYVKIADLIESARLTEPDPISYLHNQASSITI
jgi:hypothetical protein